MAELLAVAEDGQRERRRKATDRLIGYFAKHTQRLNYAERLGAGRAIGPVTTAAGIPVVNDSERLTKR